MSKVTKRQKTVGDKIDSNKLYALPDALGLVKEFAVAKFDESIDVPCNWVSMPRNRIKLFVVRW